MWRMCAKHVENVLKMLRKHTYKLHVRKMFAKHFQNIFKTLRTYAESWVFFTSLCGAGAPISTLALGPLPHSMWPAVKAVLDSSVVRAVRWLPVLVVVNTEVWHVVEGGGMEPTAVDRDIVLVNGLTQGQRGDVVLLRCVLCVWCVRVWCEMCVCVGAPCNGVIVCFFSPCHCVFQLCCCVAATLRTLIVH